MQYSAVPVPLSNADEMAIQLGQAVIDAITAHGKLYEVGGTVRDRLLTGQPEPKDADYLVTGLPFRGLMEILRGFGRVDLVGRVFGVIKFTPRGADPAETQFDFALPRKETSTGAGHRDFEVAFDHELPVEQDLYRRDFTINAIAREVVSGVYVDPLNGRADIESRLIRITTPESFREDPLRMLRAIQFAARFEFAIEPETLAALRREAGLIKTVSPERIAEELNKLLVKAAKPSIGFKLMQESGLLQHVLPELEATVGVEQPGPYHRWPVFEHTLEVIDAAPPRLLLRMAALCHDLGKPATKRIKDEGGASFYGHDALGTRITRGLLERLRYPNDFVDDVCLLVDRHMFNTEVTDKGLRRLVRRTGTEMIFELLELRRADTIGQGMGQTNDDVDFFERRIREEIDKRPPFGLKDLAVNGNDLMRIFALEPGKRVGQTLDHLLEVVLDYPEKNEFETLIHEAKNFLQNSAAAPSEES